MTTSPAPNPTSTPTGPGAPDNALPAVEAAPSAVNAGLNAVLNFDPEPDLVKFDMALLGAKPPNPEQSITPTQRRVYEGEYVAGYEGMMDISLIDCADESEIPWAPMPYKDDDTEAKTLLQSLATYGQKDPILVYPSGNGRYRAVDGRNRLLRLRCLGKHQVRVKVVNQALSYRLARATYINREMNEVARSIFIFDFAETEGITAEKGKPKQEVVSTRLTVDYGWSSGFGHKNVQKYLECGKFFRDNLQLTSRGEFRQCQSINELHEAMQAFKSPSKCSEDNKTDGRSGPVAAVNRGASAITKKMDENLAEVIGDIKCAYRLQRLHESLTKLVDRDDFKVAAAKGSEEIEKELKAKMK